MTLAVSNIFGTKLNNCIWQLNNAVYGGMFFECKKAKSMQELNTNLYVLGLLIIGGVEQTHQKNGIQVYCPLLQKEKAILLLEE